MTFERDSARAAGGPENYYDVLGLTPGASDEEIEAAYTDLSGMFAADRVPAGRQDYARRQRARLAAAYGVLADPDSRSAYDARLGAARPAPVGPAAGAPAPLAEAADWAPPVSEPLSAGDAYAPMPAASEAPPALPSAMTFAPAADAETTPAAPTG